jgi:cytochrome c
MARRPSIQPSLWFAIGLVGFVLGGGVASLAVQRWQSQTGLQAAATDMTGGNPKRGKAVISRVGCGACHEIPGVNRAHGTVGPPLDKVASRAFVAGRLVNTPASLKAWIKHPQAIEPGNGMPAPPLDDQQTRDVAAYLYTLK